MKNKSVIAKSWLGLATGVVMALSASITQAAVLETEGNNTFATANAGFGAIAGSIGDLSAASNDVDIWTFGLAVGNTFSSSISYTGLYNPFDVRPVMTLFMENGGLFRPVATTDPQLGGDVLTFTPWASGSYFLAITSDFNQGVDAFGNLATTSGFLTTQAVTGTSFANFNGQSFTSFDYTVISTGAVPVPAAAWLFGSGLIGLIGVARRNKKV